MDRSETSSASHMPISDLELFRKFETVADWVWSEVIRWQPFSRNTIGQQLVEAADSVGANLVEGGGRGGDADASRFFFYARGSAMETKLWINRAVRRGLVSKDKGLENMSLIEEGIKMLNSVIRHRRQASGNSRKSVVREGLSSYGELDEVNPWLTGAFDLD